MKIDDVGMPCFVSASICKLDLTPVTGASVYERIQIYIASADHDPNGIGFICAPIFLWGICEFVGHAIDGGGEQDESIDNNTPTDDSRSVHAEITSAEHDAHCAELANSIWKERARKERVEKLDAIAVKKQKERQRALGDPVVNSIGMKFVPIPAGEFLMGSPDTDSDAEDIEKPQHLVKITQPFYLSVYEVTQQQYENVMGTRPWQGEERVREGPDYPAVYMNWNDAVEFCRKLSEQEGVEYRLPTEAQWEYACRAGTTTEYSFGHYGSKLDQYVWYYYNTCNIGEEYAHPVGQKLPNPWGLYDMHGNVGEWCHDWRADYGSENTLTNPTGPAQGEYRLLRGGPYGAALSYVRSATRFAIQPDKRFRGWGFRPARTYP